MAVTITWKDNSSDPVQWVMTDDTISRLDQYRLTLTTTQDINGVQTQVPRFTTVQELIVATFTDTIVRTAFNLFPAASVVEKQQALLAAQEALEAAKAQALNTVISPAV